MKQPKQIKLHYENRHIFVEDNHDLFVYDTGAQMSFSLSDYTPLDNEIKVQREAPGLNAKMLSDYVGVPVVGLIGIDILNQYNHIIDLKTNILTYAKPNVDLRCRGNVIKLAPRSKKGIPILEPWINEATNDYIFDTGAQFSYHFGDIPKEHIECIEIEDFWAPIGVFKTQSYHAQVRAGGLERWVHFGVPPKKLVSAIEQPFGVKGILGNELMRNRVSGYFPSRAEIILQS